LWTLAGRNSLEMYDATHTVGDAIKHCKQQIKSLKTKLAPKYPTAELENAECAASERIIAELNQ
jgi:hypothetical protein